MSDPNQIQELRNCEKINSQRLKYYKWWLWGCCSAAIGLGLTLVYRVSKMDQLSIEEKYGLCTLGIGGLVLVLGGGIPLAQRAQTYRSAGLIVHRMRMEINQAKEQKDSVDRVANGVTLALQPSYLDSSFPQSIIESYKEGFFPSTSEPSADEKLERILQKVTAMEDSIGKLTQDTANNQPTNGAAVLAPQS
jgi:hypothetical protein